MRGGLVNLANLPREASTPPVQLRQEIRPKTHFLLYLGFEISQLTSVKIDPMVSHSKCYVNGNHYLGYVHARRFRDFVSLDLREQTKSRRGTLLLF